MWFYLADLNFIFYDKNVEISDILLNNDIENCIYNKILTLRILILVLFKKVSLHLILEWCDGIYRGILKRGVKSFWIRELVAKLDLLCKLTKFSSSKVQQRKLILIYHNTQLEWGIILALLQTNKLSSYG